MGDELGTETSIGLLVGSSAMSEPIFNFRLNRERRFFYEFFVEKLVFSSFRQYLVEVESRYKIFLILMYFFFARAVLRHGKCLQISSHNS